LHSYCKSNFAYYADERSDVVKENVYVKVAHEKARPKKFNKMKLDGIPDSEMVNLEPAAGVKEMAGRLDTLKHDLVVYLNLKSQTCIKCVLFSTAIE